MLRALAILLLLAACAEPAPWATPSVVASGSDEPQPAASSEAPVPTPAVAAWEVLGDAPFARLEMAVAAHDGLIWLAGGLSPIGAALTDVDVFDPATGEWSDGPSLPTGVHHAALVSDGEGLILVGGYLGADFSRPTDIVLVLAAGADEWAAGPSLPEPRAAGAAAFDGFRVIYAGGVSTEDIHSDVFALEGGSWEQIGNMASSREHLAATSDGEGTVWLMGGRVGGLTSNLAVVETVNGDEIEHVAELPTPRGGVAAFHTDETGACLTGGEAPDQAYTVVECVGDDGTVASLPSLNEPHHGHGASVVAGVVYVLLGGPQPTLSADSTVEAFAPAP
jgi:Galactose oxidase, central domain